MKLAIITGGSEGLGKELVSTYTNAGFQTVEFSRSGTFLCSVNCDFSDTAQSSNIVDTTLSHLAESKYSEIVLINNVGTINPIGPISESNMEKWIDCININLVSSIVVSGLFVKHFQDSACKKTIGSISSGAAIKGKYGWSLYCAAKAGLEHFCNALAIEQEQQAYPISITIINPGIIDTGMQASIRSSTKSQFPELQRFLTFHRKGLLSQPSTVANKIFSLLANDDLNGKKHSTDDL